MAENRSVDENNARFVDYPYDLRKQTSLLQARKLTMLASRVRPGERVLDVGCNSGHLADFLDKCEVHGVDLSPTLVAEAQKYLASAQVASAEHLPFPDKSFDVVVMAGVLEYFFDPYLALCEACRVVRRVIVGTAEHEQGTWGSHVVARHAFMVRGYDIRRLENELTAVGTITWLDVIEHDRVPQHYLWEVQPHGDVCK